MLDEGRFREVADGRPAKRILKPMALSLISCATTSFAGAAALPNPIRGIAQPIAAIGIVGFDKRAMRTKLENAAAPLRAVRQAKDRLASYIVMSESTTEDEETPDVPPIFAVVEDTAYQPDIIGFDPNAFVQTLPGVTGPLGFFDPVGFCASTSGADGAATEGKVRFYREVELKHCRVAMLAALGFPLAEQFHPLFGGGVDVPSYLAFQQTPLQTFWPAVVFVIAVIEVFSVFPAFENPNVEGWAIKKDHVAGDYGFDPLGLKPTNPAELLFMQNKELNNGRLAMIAIAGMVGQELATGQKLF